MNPTVTLLQEGEKLFIIHGVQDNVRNDARACLDYRDIYLETDIVETCVGSAVVTIGGTKVIAGVKSELKKPLASGPDKGRIEVTIDITSHAGLEFDGRGGDVFASGVSKILEDIYNQEKYFPDLHKLCVAPGAHAWLLYVDMVVIGFDGNLADAVSMAAKAALYSSRIQVVNAKYNSDKTALELEYSDDPNDCIALDVTNLPVLITFNRIGTEFVVDATKQEEACSKSNLVFAVSDGDIVVMKQMGGEGSLHMDSICDIMETAVDAGMQLQKGLLTMLKEEEKIPKSRQSQSSGLFYF